MFEMSYLNELEIDDLQGRIANEIYKQNKSKAEVAEACGFSKKRLYGQNKISLVYFARLCVALNVSADYLLFGKTKNNQNLCGQDMKDLMELAEDFKLLEREDVQEIIENCKSYVEGQRKIMGVYDKVYMR